MKYIWLLFTFTIILFTACSVEEGSGSMESSPSELTNTSDDSDSTNAITSDTQNEDSEIDNTSNNSEEVTNSDEDTEIINIEDEVQSDVPPTMPESLSGLIG